MVWALVGDDGSSVPGAERAALLADWDEVMGLGLVAEVEAPEPELPAGAEALIAARAAARESRDWTESDRLRDELATLGVEVTDTRDGQEWQRPPLRLEGPTAQEHCGTAR